MKKRLLISLLAVGAIFSLAACKKEIFEVSFDSSGTIETIEVTENGLIVEPTAPTREGYTFGGWYLDAECTQKVDFATYKVVGDVTLYAQWLINSYTVSFESNGGSSVEDITVEHGKPVTLPANPTKEGHTFSGWFADQNLTQPYTNSAITGNTKLYAKWKSNVIYTGTFSGEAAYNSEDGTYSFELDLQQWNRFSVFYNKEVISAKDENLVITGYFTEGAADWTMNLYCDVPENGVDVDYTTFITSTGGKYRVTYDPASHTLDFQDATPPIEIPQEGFCFQYTDATTNKLGEATSVEANADGSYTFVVELIAWRYVKMYYNGEVVDTALNATLQSSGNIYIGDGKDPSYAFYTNQAGKFEFTYIPATDGGMAVVKAGPYKDPSEMPAGVAFGYTITQGTDAVEVLADASEVTVENGVYTVTVTLQQWRYVVIYVDGVAVPVADMTISGDGWVDGTHASSSNGSLYVPEDPTHLMTSQAGGIQYTVSYNPTDKSLVIDNLSIGGEQPDTPLPTEGKIVVGGTFEQELEAVDGVYTLQATFAKWNRFSFTLEGVELTTSNVTITGCFVNQADAPWDERFYTEDGKVFLYSGSAEAEYIITYTVATETINIELVPAESPVPAEGVYFEHTNPENTVVYPGDGEIEEVDGTYSITVTLNQWRYVAVYYNGVKVNVADMTISGDGWVDGTYDSSTNGSLYVDSEPAHLLCSQKVEGGISYKLTYNPTNNTLIINNLSIEDEVVEESVYTLVAEAKGLSWTEETQLGDSGIFFATNKVKTESLKITGASYEADGLTFEFQYSLTGGKVQLTDGVFLNGIKLVLADYTKVTLYAAQKSDKTTNLKVIDTEGNEVTVSNLLIDGVAADAWNTLPTDKVSKYEFNLPAGTYYLGGAGGGAYVYQVNVEYVEEVSPEVPADNVWPLANDEYAQVITEAGTALYDGAAWIANGWRLYVVVDAEGRIAYMVQFPPNGYGNPNETSYARHSLYAQKKSNPAFADLDSQWKVVVPEGGMAIVVYAAESFITKLLGSYTEHGVNNASVNVDSLRLVYDAENAQIVINEVDEPVVVGVHYEYTDADAKLLSGLEATYAESTHSYSFNVTLNQWRYFALTYNGKAISSETTTVTGDYAANGIYQDANEGMNEFWCNIAGGKEFVVTYYPATNTLDITYVTPVLPGLTYGGTHSGNIPEANENGEYVVELTFAQWGRVEFYFAGQLISSASTTVTGDFAGAYSNIKIKELYHDDGNTTLFLCAYADGGTYTFTYNPDKDTLHIEDDLITTTGFEIAETAGVAATNQHIYVNSVAVVNNFSVSGTLVIGTAGNNPHIQFSLDESNFNNRFLLWDQDNNGSFIASYAFAGSHRHAVGKGSVAAGEEVQFEVVTTVKHSYFYINGVLEFVFLNMNAQNFVIGGEKVQVTATNIKTVTSADEAAWAEVLARPEMVRYEATVNPTAKALIHTDEIKNTTSVVIASNTSIGSTNTEVYKNGEALYNNFSISGKILATSTGSNPHIQFLFANGKRFLLWDNDNNGSYQLGWQDASGHKNNQGTLKVNSGEEATFEIVCTTKHAYLYINGELALVYYNINPTSLNIGAQNTELSLTDLSIITSANAEWANVLAREEIAAIEASDVTDCKGALA